MGPKQSTQSIQTYDPSSWDSIATFAQTLLECEDKDISDDFLILNIKKTIQVLNDTQEARYGDEKTFQILRVIQCLTFFVNKDNLFIELKNEGLHSIFLKLVEHEFDKNEFNPRIIRAVYTSLSSLTRNSSVMAIENMDKGFHITAAQILDRINFIESIERCDYETLELSDRLIDFILKNTFYMEVKEALIDINIINRFSDYLNKIESKQSQIVGMKYIKLNLLSTIGNLMNDFQLDASKFSQDYVTIFIEILKNIIERENKKLFENTRYYIIYKLNVTLVHISATTHLNKIMSVAVNDTIKQKLFEFKVIPLLEELIRNGNDKEIERSTQLLCSLSFNENVVKYIKEKHRTIQLIKNVARTSNNDKTKQSCQQILLMTNSSFGIKKTLDQNKQHIMISYNHIYQERCLKIYAELTKRGYHTWMDIHTVFTDLNDAMAEAVENASIVIICYSYEYKISNNCRLEAQYANKLNKDIIAVRVQNGYNPDGWLGMLLASKLYIDLSGDTSSSTAYKSLFSQIENLLVKNNTVGKSLLNQTSNQVTTTQQVEVNALQWTTDEVADWLKNNKLENLIPAFKTYTGIAIKALAEMKEKNYDKFCDTIDKEIEGANLSVATSEKLIFYQLIQDLFRH